MKLKWHSHTPEQEKKAWAIVLLGFGLFMLLKVPERFALWAIPGVEDAPSFGKLGMQLMIIGGVSLVLGAAMAWWAWARPKHG
jgi:hypothetical protein